MLTCPPPHTHTHTHSQVMFALATIGPVAVNVDAIPMQSYGGGLMTACAMDSTHIDHVVQLVGYGYDANFDKNYWILRNSWGGTLTALSLSSLLSLLSPN